MRSETLYFLSLSRGVMAKCQLSVPPLLVAKAGKFSCFKSPDVSKGEERKTFAVLQL